MSSSRVVPTCKGYHEYDWEGLRVDAIFWDESSVSVGNMGCISITPYSSSGEMGWTLWFEALFEGGRITRFNAAMLEGVTSYPVK